MRSKYRNVLAGLLLVAALAAGMWWASLQNQSSPPAIEGVLWPPKTLHPFSLVDQTGRPFDLSHLQGVWSFLFFGYTHCPDVCPATLRTFNGVRKRLADLQASTRFVFVSVDPGRDTPAQLDQYVSFFNRDFIGATGSEAQLDGLTSQLGIAHMKEENGDTANYAVDHTASILLIDPQGRFVAVFSPPHDAEDIAGRYRRIRAFVEQHS